MDDLTRFCCQNSDCALYGRRDAGNLSVGERSGKPNHIRLLSCNACQARSSERKGTPLFDCRLPEDKAHAVRDHLAEGNGIRQTERLVGVHRDTVSDWPVPPEANAEFVAAREEVRDVYHRPFDPKRPLVGRDETSQPLIGEVAEPMPAEPKRPERIDSEYVRNGTADLFLIPEPWAGWRHVEVTERRTAKDFAEVVRWVVEDLHPDAEKIVLVIDDRNTHDGASLYETFPPVEARRLLDRIEFHYTPKRGSWLNMAETEISIMGSQCLDRRLDSQDRMAEEVAAWESERNARKARVHWTFTLAATRRKLRKLYPSIEV
jgi:hypothetical protein